VFGVRWKGRRFLPPFQTDTSIHTVNIARGSASRFVMDGPELKSVIERGEICLKEGRGGGQDDRSRYAKVKLGFVRSN
jgi:hypothetical protein